MVSAGLACPSQRTIFLPILRVLFFSPHSFLAFTASVTFMEDYTFRLRIHIFAYQNCEMPIFDVDL